MEDLNHKRSIRRGHRASATRMLRKAEDSLAQETINYSQLARIKPSLQEKVSILKRLDSDIKDLVSDEEAADEIDKADTYMEDIYDMMARLEQLLQKDSSVPTPATIVLPSMLTIDV